MSELCARVHQLVRGLRRYSFPFDPRQIPENGIYVLFEKGEIGHGDARIVRVGTHTGDGQLRSRLHQHFLHENKDRSIFRKNIGRSLLNREDDPFLELWNLDLTSRDSRRKYADQVDRERLAEVERRVTKRIQSFFRFAVLEVPDKTARLRLESRLISTVSLCEACGPSDRWLGAHNPHPKIRQSGLWQVNEIYKQPLSESELSFLQLSTESSNRT